MEKEPSPRRCLDMFTYNDGSIKLRLGKDGEQGEEISTFKNKASLIELLKQLESLKPQRLRKLIDNLEKH